MSELMAGVYKHYKNEFYLVLGLARHHETDEQYVVYVPLYVREGPRICIREVDNFLGIVDEVCPICRSADYTETIAGHPWRCHNHGCNHYNNLWLGCKGEAYIPSVKRFEYVGTEVPQ